MIMVKLRNYNTNAAILKLLICLFQHGVDQNYCWFDKSNNLKFVGTTEELFFLSSQRSITTYSFTFHLKDRSEIAIQHDISLYLHVKN